MKSSMEEIVDKNTLKPKAAYLRKKCHLPKQGHVIFCEGHECNPELKVDLIVNKRKTQTFNI